MTEFTGGPIVVGVDGSEASLRAVRCAAEEARWRHARLRIVHAVEPPAFHFTSGYVDTAGVLVKMRAEGQRIVTEAGETAGGAEVETAVPTIAPAKALLAESRGAQLLVLGMTGQSAFPGLMVGSLPATLAAHAHCPVAVVRGESRQGPIVAGIDGGPWSDAVIGVAIEEAAHRGVPLIAAHAWSDSEFEGGAVRPYFGWEPVAEAEREILTDTLAGWQNKYPEVVVERVFVRDRPRHLLLEWSRTARLVVVGSRGRGGFAGLLLGSTGQALVHHALGPVLVVRS
ncbi:universal stress protein [Amycolatopsis sp.]|uniref:universal stress protein n=1 Tax=Amycolatopsis sp. TaxID=37632 RepID=UPI002BED1A14|nr:universal stress protein [Amycolatopsis sp.]HVV09434.1 universal stress protein [Amycolatopsis sp.]